MKNVVRLSGFSTGRAIRIVRKPNVFAEKIIGSVPTIRFGTEYSAKFGAKNTEAPASQAAALAELCREVEAPLLWQNQTDSEMPRIEVSRFRLKLACRARLMGIDDWVVSNSRIFPAWLGQKLESCRADEPPRSDALVVNHKAQLISGVFSELPTHRSFR